MSDREQLRVIDRALWVDRGDGNLDALTTELPIWADEWAETIVQAVNERQALPLSHRQSMQAIRDRDEAQSRAAVLAEDLQDARDRIAELEAAQRSPLGGEIVQRPDAKNPTPALIEAAYIAQDDLSKPPERWAIEAAAEVIAAYIDAQDHTEVHVLGHPREAQS
ncbi:hypothetical protein [Nocardia flavorosea]|uniref:Uncharacterized protein n=1 Tax=Nocardia flavorosea TaxID=53429 RepID=A0A846YSY4_9NOCA|nr:hypothetical protein [Nocardia flavorosea]NKY60392.1 hypothetical protein [Nocardia flavorosea]